ncbi:protein-glutamine gamma-glutamyltransferase E-like [Discoglossus pictus]
MAALQVINSDLQINGNRTAHNTNIYVSNELIVRRGQPFEINMMCNRSVTAEDKMQFNATLLTTSGSSLLDYTFPESSSTSSNVWGARRKSNGYNSMTVTIFPPPDAVIGRYSLRVQTSGGIAYIGNFVLLFNVWARGDTVYLADQAQRDEYVLSEFGLIFMGDAGNPGGVPWNYGQFQESILDISLALLDSTVSFRNNPSQDVRRRNDPSHLCRVLSSIVNGNDENGVVEGNWSGEYSDGTDPNAWIGSGKVLKSWFSTRRPVKYGQCWVFAGVACTVSRALGLPCRVITNYISAHDSDNSLQIEDFYNASGEPVSKNDDSIWNFHCWNESWFLRSDLGVAYSGWQIWDATPQETSDGIYQVGPTSQRAVKEGDLNVPYDARFVFSEVNADVLTVFVQQDGSYRRGETNSQYVGRLICTKAVGRNTLTNLTGDYKYPEGSSTERNVYNRAIGGSGFVAFSASGDSAQPSNRPRDVSGDLVVSGTPMIGEDITVTLTLKNLTSENREVTAHINATAIVYNKGVRRPILKDSVAVPLGPNEVKQVPILIHYSQYENKLTSDNMIYVTSVCQIEKWGELLLEKNISLKKPDIQIQALGQAVKGSPVTVEVTFTNPLSNPVTNCVLTAEGSGLTQDAIHKTVGNLEPEQKINIKLDILPYVSGTKQLLINFTCDKINDIKGFININVADHST